MNNNLKIFNKNLNMYLHSQQSCLNSQQHIKNMKKSKLYLYNKQQENKINDYMDKPNQCQNKQEKEISLVNKIEWNEDMFDKINQASSFKNKFFTQQKTDIFQSLGKYKIFIYKLIDSNQKGDLFIGIQKQGESSNNDKIIEIMYNQTQEYEKEKHILAMDALEYQYNIIQINENITHIFILDKEECLKIDKKLKQFMESIQTNLNFYQFGDLFQYY
ncbi:hypothetical protein ABPG72_002408 [Tetrahymena utriculariae]